MDATLDPTLSDLAIEVSSASWTRLTVNDAHYQRVSNRSRAGQPALIFPSQATRIEAADFGYPLVVFGGHTTHFVFDGKVTWYASWGAPVAGCA